ncbi:MAG: trehalose-phosphatase [Candidatus Omnitrophota bacterium]
MKYLFNYLSKIREVLEGKALMLFLDYDGTLTPIVRTPDKAVLSRKVKKVLSGLSQKPDFKLAIISGRALEDVQEKVGLKNIIYVGNHGFEIEGAKIKFRSIISVRFRAILDQLKKDLGMKLSGIKGVLLEDKGLSLSLHYRLVDKRQIPEVRRILHEAAFFYVVRNKIKIKSGKKVLEIRPPIDWDKGKVVLWLLARGKFASQGKAVFPVYIGDDKTDEDAFKALRRHGLTVFVGKTGSSLAEYYLKNTKEVLSFLKIIYAGIN